jgi:hypothetical protein
MKKYFKFTSGRFAILIFMLLFLAITVFLKCEGPSDGTSANFEQGFLNPPESSKPRVWWHWMNGNITKEGIKADLEWMKRAGIGGFQNFDAGIRTPKIVEERLVYMTPEWKEAFLYATKLADSLGLEMAIAGSPGWSESGGPWVSPEQAMKKLVWSEIRIKGGNSFTGKLPHPPSESGVFQNMSINDENIPEYYDDIAVIAYKAPSEEVLLADLNPKVTSSGGKFDIIQLTDGDVAKSVILPVTEDNDNAWIQFEFSEPEEMQSLTIACNLSNGLFGRTREADSIILEVSNDAITYRPVVNIPTGRLGHQTVTFQPVKGKYFRILFKTEIRPPAGILSEFVSRNQERGIRIAELVLYNIARVNRFEEKAGFATATDLISAETPPVNKSIVINESDIVDLTSMMQPDGTLNWTPSEGNWVVLRFGYSLTGKQNHPASPEATGLEVDKLNAKHVKAYFDNYLDQYKDATGGLMGKRGLQFVITDSWEAGVQNWTDNMISEFNNRRGYDILKWMPVLTGRIVESARASDRFLWDYRKTIADITVENHYDQLTTILEGRNMGRYTESHESGRAFIADGMEVKRGATVPMSATWTPREGQQGVATRYKADIRESASVAHIYGKDFVAAESLTARGTAWAWSPETLKPTADMELANGLNRFVIHTSVHQPLDDKIPGLGLGPYGQWFTRHETWADKAIAWTTYLARSCFMLQQGKFVADIIYFYGEDNNITALFGNKLPDIPEGYNYDFVNSDALVNVLSVENGNITTPGGSNYRILVLDSNCKYMSLPVLKKISEMVKAGAVVVGEKPVDTPSLVDDQDEFNAIVKELWSDSNGENTVGKGKVFGGHTIAEVLAGLDVAPDFQYSKPQNDTEILFVHHRLDDIDIYWVNNRNDRVEELETTFRVKGKAPEVWHPGTGKIENISYSFIDDHTNVPLHLKPNDAVFIVFRKKAAKTSFKVPQPEETQLSAIDGSWKVSFQSDRGAPEEIVLDQLISWSKYSDPGVKYFSGTGTYTKNIQASAGWFNEDTQIWLDLGSVKNLAEVFLNGQSMGIVWKKPFRINITEPLKEGDNLLEVKVTNLWVNRLIGDQQPDVENKITYTAMKFYEADSPLLPSGLLGPVTIVGVSSN